MSASAQVTKRRTCRLCLSDRLALEVPLPEATLADFYCRTTSEHLPKFAIDIYRCRDCNHLQLLDVVDPNVLFHEEFTYKPSNNPDLIAHFDMYANLLKPYFAGTPAAALDVGSNDGLFLERLKALFGCRVVGVDPAKGPADFARSRGIETLQELFTDATVEKVKAQFGSFDLVSANNVFAHNDDLIGFARNAASLLTRDGVFSFEFSYALDVVCKGMIGTVFHEHLSTHSVVSLIPFLRRAGLELVDVHRVETQGGAAIGITKRIETNPKVHPRVGELVEREIVVGLDSSRGAEFFRRRITEDKRKLQGIFQQLQGRKIAAFGAARSANLLVEYFDIGRYIAYVVDDNQTKLGKFFNDHHIPIVASSTLDTDKPDAVVILAWIHTDKIIKRLRGSLPGAKFIRLFPEISVE